MVYIKILLILTNRPVYLLIGLSAIFSCGTLLLFFSWICDTMNDSESRVDNIDRNTTNQMIIEHETENSYEQQQNNNPSRA